MNIWSQNISYAIQNYIFTNKLQVDLTTLNSNTLVYSSSCLYVLFKVINKDKIELKLLIVDLSKIISGGNVSVKQIRCTNIVLYADNERNYLSHKYKDSRIELQINPLDPSYWLLTITSSPKSNPKTRIYLSSFQYQSDKQPPVQISFHLANTSSSQISKVKFHPESSQHFVIVYKKLQIDYVNYLRNMNYPEIEINVGDMVKVVDDDLEFVDIQFGTDIQDLFNIYILTNKGSIYVTRVLLDQVVLSDVKSVGLKISKQWRYLEKYFKTQKNLLKIQIDTDDYLSKLQFTLIEKHSNKSKKQESNYSEFRYFKVRGCKAFTLLQRTETQRRFQYYFEVIIVPFKNKKKEESEIKLKSRLNVITSYQVQSTHFKHYYNSAFLSSASLEYPKFIESNNLEQFIYVLHLNVLYRMELKNLFDFLKMNNPLKQACCLSANTNIVSNKILISQKQYSSQIEPKNCGYYGILFIQSILIIVEKVSDNSIKLNAISVDQKLNNNQIQILKKQFEKIIVNVKDSQDRKQEIKNSQHPGRKLDYSLELNNLMNSYQINLEQTKKQIKNKQMKVCILRQEFNKKYQINNTNNLKKERLITRLQQAKNRLNNLLNINKQQNKILSDPRAQIYQQKIQQMRHEFESGRNSTNIALSELEISIGQDIKPMSETIDNNLNEVNGLVEKMKKIVQVNDL